METKKTEVTIIKLYKEEDDWIARITEGDTFDTSGIGAGRTPSEALEALAFFIQWNKLPAIIKPDTYRKD